MVKSGIVERTKGFFARSGVGRNNNNNNNNKHIFSIAKQDDDPAVLLLSNQNKNQHEPTIPEEASTTTNHNNNVKTTFVGRMPEQQGNDDKNNEEDIPPVVIVGAGIVGLVLALALDKHCGIQAEVYEQAPAFHDDVGAGMGMYPNGLRVIRDISPKLLQQIQQAGCPYVIRRYEVRRVREAYYRSIRSWFQTLMMTNTFSYKCESYSLSFFFYYFLLLSAPRWN